MNLDKYYEKPSKLFKINYNDIKDIKKYTSEEYKGLFNSKYYTSYYKDLNSLALNDAWNHWVNHGIKENRIFFVLDKNAENIKQVNTKLSNKTIQKPVSAINNSSLSKSLVTAEKINKTPEKINKPPEKIITRTRIKEGIINKPKHNEMLNNNNKIVADDSTYDSKVKFDDVINDNKVVLDDSMNNNINNSKSSLKNKKYNEPIKNNDNNVKIDVKTYYSKGNNIDSKVKFDVKTYSAKVNNDMPKSEQIVKPDIKPDIKPYSVKVNNDMPKSEKIVKPDIKPYSSKVNNDTQKPLEILYNIKQEDDNLNVHLIRNNNLVIKDILDGYGLHYYGWKNVINNFMEYYNTKKDNVNYSIKEQYFFEEYLEKMLIWGDKRERKFLLNEINKNNYKIITFIHNAPFTKWYNNTYKNNVIGKVIFNDTLTNKNVFELLEEHKLKDKITYLCTLSNTHKEYLCSKNDKIRKKIITLLHPIEITGNEKTFDFTLFSQLKRIIHIGWRMRNFKSFIDFKNPIDFCKTILIKKDFENEWNNIVPNLNLENIVILKQLSNSDYARLFTNSCVFLDMEDSTATNVILECIKFNTPIIIRKLPSIVEYLGCDYPLYFEKENDLLMLQNPNYFFTLINDAHKYLENMDKSHIQVDNFNIKFMYHLDKLENLEKKNQVKLTWFCLIDNLYNIDDELHNLYNNFISQNNNKNIKLVILIDEKTNVEDNYHEFVSKIQKYSELVNNIRFIIKYFDSYNDFLNYCFEIVDTEYLTIVTTYTDYDANYSIKCIDYMNNTPACDIAFTSYITTNNNYEEKHIFEKDYSVFESNINKLLIPESGIVFRKNIISICGLFQKFADKNFVFREFFSRMIKKKLNIMCNDNEASIKIKIF